MTDKTVTVTLTEDEARELARFLLDDDPDQNWKHLLVEDAGRKVRSALPPEWEEGTVAWVASDSDSIPMLRQLRDGRWTLHRSGHLGFPADKAVKVEPLRVLGDDEVAVKRPPLSSDALLDAAAQLRREYYWTTADFLDEVALVVKAEEARNA